MAKHRHRLHLPLALAVVLVASPCWAAQFPIARIFIEYNSTGNDLGFHVFLDAEDWNRVSIANPSGTTIFQVNAGGAFGNLGMTELFTEGAEPSLDDVPLNVLLGMMPEGRYTFTGAAVDGTRLLSRPTLSHAVPAAPEPSVSVDGDEVVISWLPVSGTPPGFPNRSITIVGYQVIVGSFQVTLPASRTSVEIPEEFIASLPPGEQPFEVLAIDASGNQTITEGTFDIN